MAVNSKDIEILWKQYSEEGAKQGISVAQFFESNGIPYHCFEKWYKKKFSKNGIVDCVVAGLPDATIQVPEGEKAEGRWHTGKKYFLKIARNMQFVREYPAEALCEPVFRTWHFFWRVAHIATPHSAP